MVLLSSLVVIACLGVGPGTAPPALDAPDLAGEMVRLQDLKGQVVLVDFWATWCAPCRESLPYYAALQKRLGPEGLTILAVSIDDEKSNVTRFMKRLGPGLRVIHDADKRIVGRYAPPTMPTAYLIDRSGKVVLVHEGFTAAARSSLEAAIERLLAP